MKKVYPLQAAGKHPDRLLDAIKHDIRKYIKRCRGAALPAGVDFWDFDCLLGADKASAVAVHPSELIKQLDVAAAAGQPSVHVEVLPKAGHRKLKTAQDAPDQGA